DSAWYRHGGAGPVHGADHCGHRCRGGGFGRRAVPGAHLLDPRAAGLVGAAVPAAQGSALRPAAGKSTVIWPDLAIWASSSHMTVDSTPCRCSGPVWQVGVVGCEASRCRVLATANDTLEAVHDGGDRKSVG